jgi:hypothetical protein
MNHGARVGPRPELINAMDKGQPHSHSCCVLRDVILSQ